jgi:hypothetical protein
MVRSMQQTTSSSSNLALSLEVSRAHTSHGSTKPFKPATHPPLPPSPLLTPPFSSPHPLPKLTPKRSKPGHRLIIPLRWRGRHWRISGGQVWLFQLKFYCNPPPPPQGVTLPPPPAERRPFHCKRCKWELQVPTAIRMCRYDSFFWGAL